MADTTLVPGIASGIAVHWHTPDRPHTLIRRLIVLLPDTDMNEVVFARVLWMLAGHNGSRVRLIAKVEDWANRGLVEVRVALLESFLREANIELSTVFDDSTNDWVQIVRHEYLPGDAIVCHAEQKLPVRAQGFGIEVSSLSHHLAMLHMPVCELQGILIGLQKMTFVRVAQSMGRAIAHHCRLAGAGGVFLQLGTELGRMGSQCRPRYLHHHRNPLGCLVG